MLLSYWLNLSWIWRDNLAKIVFVLRNIGVLNLLVECKQSEI